MVANTIEVDDSSVEDRSLPPPEHQHLRQVDDGTLDACGTARPLRHHVRERNERRAQVITHLVVLEQCEEDLVRVAIREPAQRRSHVRVRRRDGTVNRRGARGPVDHRVARAAERLRGLLEERLVRRSLGIERAG